MTVAQANAWHYWLLIDQGADNQGLTDGSGNPAKRMFALGNFSRSCAPVITASARPMPVVL